VPVRGWLGGRGGTVAGTGELEGGLWHWQYQCESVRVRRAQPDADPASGSGSGCVSACGDMRPALPVAAHQRHWQGSDAGQSGGGTGTSLAVPGRQCGPACRRITASAICAESWPLPVTAVLWRGNYYATAKQSAVLQYSNRTQVQCPRRGHTAVRRVEYRLATVAADRLS
jgi:hypothetical protein